MLAVSASFGFPVATTLRSFDAPRPADGGLAVNREPHIKLMMCGHLQASRR